MRHTNATSEKLDSLLAARYMRKLRMKRGVVILFTGSPELNGSIGINKKSINDVPQKSELVKKSIQLYTCCWFVSKRRNKHQIYVKFLILLMSKF